MAMGRCKKTLVVKILNGAGVASSSLSRESAYTHQGAKEGGAGCFGRTNGLNPQRASGGRSGIQLEPSIDWYDQAHMWPHTKATTSPCCAFKWFASRLVVVEEGVAPLNADDIVMHQMQFLVFLFHGDLIY